MLRGLENKLPQVLKQHNVTIEVIIHTLLYDVLFNELYGISEDVGAHVFFLHVEKQALGLGIRDHGGGGEFTPFHHISGAAWEKLRGEGREIYCILISGLIARYVNISA